MTSTAPVAIPVAEPSPIHDAIVDLEHRLAAMQRAVLAGDAPTIEAEAYGLQRALAACAPLLPQARVAGKVPASTRAMALSLRARTAAQRDALARAGAAADRALAILTGQNGPEVYSSTGTNGARAASDLAKA
jgi:hypothetical protein